MRHSLKPYEGERKLFTAVVAGRGKSIKISKSKRELVKTLLLIDIRGLGEIFVDHMWIPETREIQKLALKAGDKIEFRATVTAYRKGYRGLHSIPGKEIQFDYKFDRVRKVVKLEI